jgi:hypothetical protein
MKIAKEVIAKAVKEESRCIGDLKGTFVGDPILQSRKRFSASEAAGNISLSWYRGQHKAQFDCYKVLEKKYPEAAKYLLEFYCMNTKGTIVL